MVVSAKCPMPLVQEGWKTESRPVAKEMKAGVQVFSTSQPQKVSLAKEDALDPSEREKDGVCHTLPGDEYIIEQRESSNTTNYWNNRYKVSPPW